MSVEREALLHELEAIPGCAAAKRRVRQLFVTLVGQRIFFSRSVLERPARVQLARSMLAAGMARADIMRALVERLQVSEATAYRLINDALIEPRPPIMKQPDLFR